jgi:acetyl esterase/lipase
LADNMTLSRDPEITAALEALPPTPEPLPVGDWAARRARMESDARDMAARFPRTEAVAVEHTTTPADDGGTVGLRVYRPAGQRSATAVVYLHGGGHFACDVETSDPLCRRYAADSGATIVSVDYRLAPEHPYPRGICDGYAALVWAAQHVEELGGRADHVMVMGDSAGGGMAAGLALLARDRGGPPIARQILIYPMLDDATRQPDPELAGLLLWHYDDNVTAWRCLLGDQAGTDDVEPYAAPARADDLADLPPAYIEVGQLDAFRDESIAYAMALSRAGVDTELLVRPGVPHDFEWIAPRADVTLRAFADRARALRG